MNFDVCGCRWLDILLRGKSPMYLFPGDSLHFWESKTAVPVNGVIGLYGCFQKYWYPKMDGL